uniref:Uncharacterized protein n=1 Tax=Mola mola TaxID=94237 RepID=A0A3Q3X4S6_MOLML
LAGGMSGNPSRWMDGTVMNFWLVAVNCQPTRVKPVFNLHKYEKQTCWREQKQIKLMFSISPSESLLSQTDFYRERQQRPFTSCSERQPINPHNDSDPLTES